MQSKEGTLGKQIPPCQASQDEPQPADASTFIHPSCRGLCKAQSLGGMAPWEGGEGHLLVPTFYNNALLTTESMPPTRALQS